MKLDTVPIYVTDQDAAKKFYSETLEFRVVQDIPMGPEQRWLEVAPPDSSVRLVLYKATAEQHGAESLRDGQARIGTFTGYVFGTDDIQSDRQRLGQRGVAFTMEPDEQPWGTFAIFADPDRNSFGLRQPPAAQAHAR